MQETSPDPLLAMGHEEAQTASCSEQDDMLVKPPSGICGARSVGIVAAMTVLVSVVAGTTWTLRGTVTIGEKLTGLETVYASYDTIGCSNWIPISGPRQKVASKAECLALCDNDHECTSANFQATACEPGWPVAGGCLLFHGACVTERNRCWELSYKPISTTLTAAVVAGATELPVKSVVGFQEGNSVTIDGGGNQETFNVVGFGSIMIHKALAHSYPVGSTVTLNFAAPPEGPSANGPTNGDVQGYYAWTWSTAYVGPEGTNMGICFSGYEQVDKAIAECSKTVDTLNSVKWISIGGNGNPHGTIMADVLSSTASNADAIVKAGYGGVIFDVEVVVGTNDALVSGFSSASKALKEKGLEVGITTSHSGPTDVSGGADAATLVKGWVADPNLAVLSPQLYTTGKETDPDFAETASCLACIWDIWQGSVATIAPSIVTSAQYQEVKTHFSDNFGITTGGYIQWQQSS